MLVYCHRPPLRPLHLPASLDSTGITPLHRYYGGSDFCMAAKSWPRCSMQISSLTVSGLRDRSVTNHPTASRHRFDTLPFQRVGLPVTVDRSGLRHSLTDSPHCLAESCSPGHVSQYPCYGPVFHLQQLPTPPHGDAVALGYGPENACPERTYTSLTKHTHERTSAAHCAARPSHGTGSILCPVVSSTISKPMV